jgi:3D (Asp-Asp-Asp) domain-containing protein
MKTNRVLLMLLMLLITVLILLSLPHDGRPDALAPAPAVTLPATPPTAPATPTGVSPKAPTGTPKKRSSVLLPTDPLLLQAYRAVILEDWGPLEPWKLNAYRKVLNNMMHVQGRCMTTSYCRKCDPSAHGDAWKYQPNVTCAAGPGVPINSIVWIKGHGLQIVTDRGGAVHDGHFDLFAGASCPEGCNDGTYSGVPYAVIEWGKTSKRHHTGRSHHRHARRKH